MTRKRRARRNGLIYRFRRSTRGYNRQIVVTGNVWPELITVGTVMRPIDGFEAQKTRIDGKIAELRALLPGGSTEANVTTGPAARKRRKMSAAARKRISDAQRKRWEASKKAAESMQKTLPKRKLSPARKAALMANLAKARAARAAKRAAA